VNAASLQARARVRAANLYRRTLKVTAAGLRPALAPMVHREPAALGPGTVLFWGPEAGVAPHLAALEIVGRTLEEQGVPTAFVRCHEVFPRCPVMDMDQLPEPPEPGAARASCDRCLLRSVTMLARYRLPVVPLVPLWHRIEPVLRPTLDARPDDLLSFRYRGAPVGEVALHDLLLAHQLVDHQQVPIELHDAWWDRIRSGVIAYAVADELCAGGNVARLVYFDETSNNVCARLAAAERGVPSTTLSFAAHLGTDRTRFVLSDRVMHDTMIRRGAQWPTVRDRALTAVLTTAVADDVAVRVTNRGGSRHIYSPAAGSSAAEVARRLGLDRAARTIVAYTSSLDEDLAARTYWNALGIDHAAADEGPFSSQVEWLQVLAGWVGQSTDWQLVVRVHPREGSGRAPSRHFGLLQAALEDVSSNVHLLGPMDPLSSYDLARVAHVVAVSWSSIGGELARCGVPVLATSVGALWNLPRNDGIAWEPTVDRYLERLQELGRSGGHFTSVVMAFRWYAFRNLGLSINVADLVGSPRRRGLPRWRSPSASTTLVHAVQGTGSIPADRTASESSQEQEADAIRGQLGRLLTVFVNGTDPKTPIRVDTRANVDGGLVVGVDGDELTLAERAGTRRRWSPLEARMARLATAP
jgi:hypothetical protein